MSHSDDETAAAVGGGVPGRSVEVRTGGVGPQAVSVTAHAAVPRSLLRDDGRLTVRWCRTEPTCGGRRQRETGLEPATSSLEG